MQISPKSAMPPLKYMDSLDPKWDGSFQQMQAFYDELKRSGATQDTLRPLEGLMAAAHGFAEANAGDLESAKKDYNRAMELGNDACLKCYANILIEAKETADLIPVLTRILQLNPNDVWALDTRRMAYFKMNDMRDGVVDLKTAAALGDPWSQNYLGVLYMSGLPGLLDPDRDAGVELFRKAAAQGYEDAKKNLLIATAMPSGHQ